MLNKWDAVRRYGDGELAEAWARQVRHVWAETVGGGGVVTFSALEARADSVAAQPLLAALGSAVQQRMERAGPAEGVDSDVVTRARHRRCVEAAADRLDAALAAPTVDLAAEEVRLAAGHLAELGGAVHAEEVLDAVFREFCVGK